MKRNHMRPWALAFALACGCAGEHTHDDAEHGHDEPDDHGHGHGHDGASEVVTRWGATTQLFVEFPALVVGEDSPFAAHLTRLEDHLAIDRGTVVVELRGGAHPVERFVVEQPSVAGIFRPIVKPAHVGLRQVTLTLESPVASEVHDLGEFTVYPTRALADAAAAEEEDDGSISYLLEQQWKVPFGIERVEVRELRPSIPAFARLSSPPDATSIVTAPRDGRVDAALGQLPRVGDEVAAGDVLFGLGMAPAQEQGDPASLDLAVKQASIATEAAQREVDRIAPLVEQGVVARRRLDEANSALSMAKAELSSARRRKRSLGQSQVVGGRGDGLDVPSPIPGTVAELFIAPGAWVREGQELARIVDRDHLWLDVSVPEAYVGKLGDISGSWFQLDGVEGVLEIPGTALVSVGTEVDTQTRTLPVRFRIDNVGRELVAGMSTQAHLVVDTPRPGTAVRIAALVDDGGDDVVYVQTGGERFERRVVRLGIRDGAYVEVLDGVAPDEWVVTRGAYSVKLASSSTASVGHGHAH